MDTVSSILSVYSSLDVAVGETTKKKYFLKQKFKKNTHFLVKLKKKLFKLLLNKKNKKIKKSVLELKKIKKK